MKQIDQAKVKEKLAKLEPQLAELQWQPTETTDKRKRGRLVERIEYTQGKIKQVKTGQRMSCQEKRDLIAYSSIAPNFTGFAVFTLVPIIFAFVLASAGWDGNSTMEFVGLSNLFRVFTNSGLIASFKNTILYCIGTIPLALAAALGLAIILNQKMEGGNFFRTVSLFPYVASLVAVAVIWSMLFSSQKSDPVNVLLYNLGAVANHLSRWSADKGWVTFTVVLLSMWKDMGYYMIICLAGLRGVNTELYKTASLDGTNTWQRFRYITWPQPRLTILFVTITLTVNCFKVYSIVYMLTGGSNGTLNKSAIVLVHHVYGGAFRNWGLGYVSTVAIMLFLLVLAVTLIQFRGEKKYTDQEDDMR